MKPALKHLDPIMGIDVHIVQPPGPVPPLPVPHPYVGLLLDPADYVPLIGATVYINGMPRAQAGTAGTAAPPHIPLGGTFLKPPSHASELYMGSSTVSVDGEALGYQGLPVLSCTDIGMPAPPRPKKSAARSLFLPTSTAIAIPTGPPVRVGGAPTISLSNAAMAGATKGLGRAIKKARATKLAPKVSAKAQPAAEKVTKKVGGESTRARNAVNRGMCTVTGHPVDVASGKMFTEVEDFQVGEASLFLWGRTYDSSSANDIGPLGPGWHLHHHLFIRQIPGEIEVRLGDGRTLTFPPLIVGTSARRAEDDVTLSRPEEDRFTLCDAEGVTHTFRPSSARLGLSVLFERRAPGGSTTRYEHDDEGQLRAVTDGAGRRFYIMWKGDRVERVLGPHPTLPEAQVLMVVYAYDANGRLVSARDALGHASTYAYQGETGLLARERHKDGLTFYFEYDGDGPDARCTHTWGDGGIFDHRLIYDLPSPIRSRKRTLVTDSLGRSITYEHDGVLVTGKTDALGRETGTTRNAERKVVEEVDAAGGVTARSYDERGNLCSMTRPDGTATRVVYDDLDRPVIIFDVLGGEQRFRYDEEGRVVEEMDPLGNTTSYAYEGAHLSSVTQPSGATTTFEWHMGEVTRIVDPLGGVTQLLRDRLGRIVETIDPEGGVERRRYDPCGRLVRVVCPDGREVTFAYDPEGRLVARSYGEDDIRLEYFGLGQPSARTVNGKTHRVEYDTEGQVVAVVDELGRTIDLDLDPRGDIAKETSVHGIEYRYVRDARGDVREVHHPGGRVTRIDRDVMGRVTHIVRPDGSTESFDYRADGALERAESGGHEVRLERDALGRVLREVQGGTWVSSRFDRAGSRVAIESSLGLWQDIERDGAGRVSTLAAGFSTKSLGLGGGCALGLRAFSAELYRNRRGQEVARAFLGLEVGFEREAGELRGISIRRMGRAKVETLLWRKIEPQQFSETRMEQSVREGLARMAHASFGALGTAVLPDGVAEMCLPTEVMSLYREDPVADWRFGGPGALVESKDPAGRLSRYRYDEEGRIVERSGPSGTWRYTYDGAGRLSRVRRGDGRVVELRYDAFGRVILRREKKCETAYIWDGDRPLHEIRRDWKSAARARDVTTARHRKGLGIHSSPGASSSPSAPPTTGSRSSSLATGTFRIRGLPGPGGWRARSGGATQTASSAHETMSEVRTWLFHPDAFELWGKLEQDGAGQVREESAGYVVNDHVGLPAALLDGTGGLEWTDDGWNKRSGCFVAGTLVATPKGLVPIEQIRVGARVLTTLDFVRGRATLPSTRASEASSQDVAGHQSLAGSSGAPADFLPASQSRSALEEAGDDVPGRNGRPSGWSTRMDEISEPRRSAHSAEAEAERISSAPQPLRLDPRPHAGLVAAALLSAAAAAPTSAPNAPVDPLERSWHVLELTLVPDGDEDHPYAIELLRPSAWLSERGIEGPGDRVRFALDELDVEGWATLRAVSSASAPPKEARNVVSMVLSHESTDVWEIKLEGASDKVCVAGVHPLRSLEGERWVPSRNEVGQERLQTAEGAVAIEALNRVRPHDLFCRLLSGDVSVCRTAPGLEGSGERDSTGKSDGATWSDLHDCRINDVYEVGFAEGGGVLRGTGGHPLYSVDRDDWVRVRDLQVGERLQTAEGAVTIEALEKVRGVHRVYNLEVEGDHEYLVGEAGVRAHNTSPCSGGVGEQRLLGPGRPSSVVRGRLEPHELAFAEEIVGHRGGAFVGSSRRSYPGIDGHIDGIPAALKETQGGLSAVLRHASKAEAQNIARGNLGVELFIKARNVSSASLLDFARRGALTQIPRQGIISRITVFTGDGVVILPGL